MKSLETFTGQEIQALQKTVINIFETIEELFRTGKQGEEVQAKYLASPVSLRHIDDIQKVFATYPVILLLKSQQILNTQKYTKNVNENLQV